MYVSINETIKQQLSVPFQLWYGIPHSVVVYRILRENTILDVHQLHELFLDEALYELPGRLLSCIPHIHTTLLYKVLEKNQGLYFLIVFTPQRFWLNPKYRKIQNQVHL